MHYDFRTACGLVLSRTEQPLDYAQGIAGLIPRLDGGRGAFFSSGVEYPDRYSRFDFGFVDPPLEFVGRGRILRAAALNPRGRRLLTLLRPILAGTPDAAVAEDTDDALALEIAPADCAFPEEERSLQPTVFSPLRRLVAAFAGFEDTFLGLYGAFGYDLLYQFDPAPLARPRPAAAKLLHLYLPDRVYVMDRRLEQARCLDYDFTRGATGTAEIARAPLPPAPPERPCTVGAVAVDQDDTAYAANVEAARERIAAGDVFEVVLSRTFAAPFDGPPSALFRRMRQVNPSPYEFFLQFGDEQLIGASPEMFMRVEGDRVESCPIAGTIRRGADPMEDAERIRALLNSRKDEAELTMCTDVDRNDKARICVPGSVRLLDRRLIERYTGLFHTVDHVEGRLRSGFGGIDAFLSHMWAVTLTGAPKRMATRLIETMEAAPRGWYGGAIGVLALDGSVNTGITIRTVHLAGGGARYRAGASLVFDSDPLAEAEETRTKAAAFFRVIESLAEEPARPARAAARETPVPPCRVAMVDNEDSFVHTLADYFRRAGAEVATHRWGRSAAEIAAGRPDLVVHSPGPGRPEAFGMPALVRALAERGVPQFGVCLGLQGIAEAFGGTVCRLPEPRHGMTWTIEHDGTGLFEGVPSPYPAGAYHSLHAPAEALPPALRVTAHTAAGLVMALEHRRLPIAAVQFHPESILSLHGDIGLRIVRNTLRRLVTGGREAALAG